MKDQDKMPSLEDDDGSSEDMSESETELMVTTRARRTTAGNRYSTLVAQEEIEQDEEDEVTMLFAEGEGEDEDFNSDEGDEDADMSTSDDDDQGPNAAAEDLEGEEEIQKEAKIERAKKRKADLALTTVTSLKKKPKIDPTALRRAPAPKPTKRKERVSWLPESDAVPGRTSLRKQTILLRAETHAKLKENEEQRLKLKAKREKRKRERVAEAPEKMTQADRLAEAGRIERRNAKSLNRWEAMEKKRAEEQAAKLAALKDRKLKGAVITFHSSLAKYSGGAPSEIREVKKRGRKPKALLEQLAAAKLAEEHAQAQRPVPAQESAAEAAQAPTDTTTQLLDPDPASKLELMPSNIKIRPPVSLVIENDPISVENAGGKYQPQPKVEPSKEEDNSFLTGIHEYASMQPDNNVQIQDEVTTAKNKSTNSSPLAEAGGSEVLRLATEEPRHDLTETTSDQERNESEYFLAAEKELHPPDPKAKPQMISSRDGSEQALSQNSPVQNVQTTTDVDTSDYNGSVPLRADSIATSHDSKVAHQGGNVDSITAHDTGFLQSQPSPTFDEQGQASTTKTLVESPVEIISTRNLVVLDKFDDISEQTRRDFSVFYKAAKPPKHSQELCPITGLAVRYREPATGIGYANSTGYKKLQELKNQQYTWSSMLGCYVGRANLVARGVPDGFLGT